MQHSEKVIHEFLDYLSDQVDSDFDFALEEFRDWVESYMDQKYENDEEEVGDWVAANRYNPFPGEMVLVTCKTKKGILSVNRAYCDDDGVWHGAGSMSNVIAWCPLPEAYDDGG